MAIIYDLTTSSWSAILGTSVSFFLATLFVAARLLSRFWLLKTNTADDWFIIIAWVIALCVAISTISGNTGKNLEHDTSVLRRVRNFDYAFTILYNPALMATNTSILILYIRLAGNTQKLLRTASYIILFLVNIGGLILTILNAANCDMKLASIYNFRSPEKSHYIIVLYLCSAPINLFTDIAILILPIPVLTAMRLPMKQKYAMVATFSMGIFVTIVDVVRIYYLQQAIYNQRRHITKLGIDADFAWSSSMVFMWSAVEINVGITCCCIPTLRPLVTKIFSSLNFNKPPKIISLESLIQKKIIFLHRKITNKHIGGDMPLQNVSSTNACQRIQHDVALTLPAASSGIRLNLSAIGPSDSTRDIEKFKGFNVPQIIRPKSILDVSGWESFKYCAVVAVLFFLWGFSYGLLFNLNNTTPFYAELSPDNISLSSAYFGSYLVGALVIGKRVLRGYGFKATLITGLVIYAAGTLVFWPSVVLISYPGFVASNIIMGSGISVIETAANPFLVLCGPRSKSEFRLLLAQCVQALATVLSQLFSSKTVAHDTLSLIDLQWSYTAITLSTVTLALGVYYVPLPELSNDDLAVQTVGDSTSASTPAPMSTLNPQINARHHFLHLSHSMISKIYRLIKLRNITYVIALFFYVSAQETFSIALKSFLSHLSLKTTTNPKSFEAYDFILHSLFALGRFIFALLCLVCAPKILLFVALILCPVILAIIALLPRSLMITELSKNSKFSFTSLFRGWVFVLLFFEGPIFPLIFALGLQRMGNRQKSSAANLIAAACGGGIFPWMTIMARRPDTQRNIRVICGVLMVLYTLSFGTLVPSIGWWGVKEREVIQR